MSSLGGKGAVLGDSRAAITSDVVSLFLVVVESSVGPSLRDFAGVNGVDIHRLDTMVSPSVP